MSPFSKEANTVLMKTPMDILLDQVDLKCTICGGLAGECDCWEKCTCGWSREKDKPCNNPEHKDSKEAEDGSC